jgi:hypothetical protein
VLAYRDPSSGSFILRDGVKEGLQVFRSKVTKDMDLKLTVVIGDQNYKIFKKKLFKILTDEMEIQDYIDELIVLNKPLKFTQ